MTIGEVAKAAGVAASAIRFYESAGVLKPPSRKNGIRDYDPSAVEQLRVLRFYRSAGVSVEELAMMFSGGAKIRRENAHAVVLRRIAEIEDVIAQARSMKRRLRGLLGCQCNGDSKRCIIFRT
jgi:DNA-binding transcriptional MerR regulator